MNSKNTSGTKKLRNFTTSLLIILLLLSNINVYSQVTVQSLNELLPYLKQDSVEVTLAPGTYSIGTVDIDSGYFSNPLLHFAGSHNTYNFTGVTIEIATDVFRAFGNVDVNELHITGAYNIIKNLRIVDIGDTYPTKRAQSIVMDGSNNLIEGLHLATRGSYPYGYGDLFGKGSDYVIKTYKHSGILVRGTNNQLKNDTLIHRAFGHGIVCQGSVDAVIEGCYVEGEMRTTDDVLAEEGTGSPADAVDFMTVWGYRVPPGFMICLQEDGIRTYPDGLNYETGEERNTVNIQVINCTVKNMRDGITIGFADGTKYVENCTTLGCESGFWVGTSGKLVNCRGNSNYGPLLSFNYETDKYANIDLTVIDNDSTYNGSNMLAYIAGSNHTITLRDAETTVDTNRVIRVGGDRKDLRHLGGNLEYQNNLSASFNTIINQTNHPLILNSQSFFNSGTSKGPITDFGKYNLFNPSSVKDNKTEYEIFYPNPATENITIKGVDWDAFVIYNETGKVVLNGGKSGDTQTINIKNLNTGIYFIALLKNRELSQRFKMAKN
jgi:hypothetical protein